MLLTKPPEEHFKQIWVEQHDPAKVVRQGAFLALVEARGWATIDEMSQDTGIDSGIIRHLYREPFECSKTVDIERVAAALNVMPSTLGLLLRGWGIDDYAGPSADNE